MMEFLGQGSFGSVRLVKTKTPEDESLYPPVYALKAMSKGFIISSDQLDHTLDEREIVMQLRHPNVLNVYATFQSPDELFLLSEYIAGCDLWALIHNDAAKTGYMFVASERAVRTPVGATNGHFRIARFVIDKRRVATRFV